MAFQPVPNSATVVVHGVLEGDLDMVNVWHILLNTTLDQTLTDATSGVFAAAYADLAPFMATTTEFQSVTITDDRTLGAPQFNSVTGWPIIGEDNTGKLPNEVAGLLQLKTALRGPWYRGRIFISGWAVDASDGNTITGAAKAALEDITADLMATLTLQVVSRFFNKAKRATAVATPVTHAQAADLWVSQRERRPGN